MKTKPTKYIVEVAIEVEGKTTKKAVREAVVKCMESLDLIAKGRVSVRKVDLD